MQVETGTALMIKQVAVAKSQFTITAVVIVTFKPPYLQTFSEFISSDMITVYLLIR